VCEAFDKKQPNGLGCENGIDLESFAPRQALTLDASTLDDGCSETLVNG
jgi:hypothetical protein